MTGTVNGKLVPRPGFIPGAVVNFSGNDLVLAPLNLDGVRAAEPMLAKMPEIKGSAEAIAAAAEILIMSLQRNYPEMTLEELLSLLDTDNAMKGISALTDASGFRRATPGELTPASP